MPRGVMPFRTICARFGAPSLVKVVKLKVTMSPSLIGSSLGWSDGMVAGNRSPSGLIGFVSWNTKKGKGGTYPRRVTVLRESIDVTNPSWSRSAYKYK